MTQFILRRLLYSVAVVVGVSVFVFIITHMLGDPARMMLPLESTEEEVATFREAMGFNDPLHVRFWRFATNAARGDFGDSLWQREPALPLVLERVPNTMLLVLISTSLALLVAIPLGVLAALKPRSLLDRVCTVGSLCGVSLPDFWPGLILILVFAVKYGFFYTSGHGTWRHIVLPSLTLAARPIGQVVFSLGMVGLGMGLTQSPVASAVTFVVDKERLGVALGIFNMFRFISGSLGSTVFGFILQSASLPSKLRAFHLDFYLLIAVASAATVMALGLPGPAACQPPRIRLDRDGD